MNINLPIGLDLIETLQHAFSGKAYALYGEKIDSILQVSDISTISIPPDNTLIWLDINPPSKEDIANAWLSLQNYKKPDPVKFQSQVYADIELRPALLRANPIAFTILIRLLDAQGDSFSLGNIQGAINAVRGSMSSDFTPQQLSRLATYAQENGLALTFN